MIAKILEIQQRENERVAILSKTEEPEGIEVAFTVPEGRLNWALRYMNLKSEKKLIGRKIAFVGRKKIQVYLLFDLEAHIETKSNISAEIIGDINEIVEEGRTKVYIDTVLDDVYLECKVPILTLEKIKRFFRCKYLKGQRAIYSPWTDKAYVGFRIR